MAAKSADEFLREDVGKLITTMLFQIAMLRAENAQLQTALTAAQTDKAET